MVKTSGWSGKCDLADTLETRGYTDEELKNNVKIYVGDSEEPLHIESRKDLIPYYPYVIGFAGFDSVDRCATICLSSKSYVDIEEEDMLQIYLKQALKIYNRCKRKRIEFDVDDAVDEIYFMTNKEAITEVVKRVKEYGRKATIDGIHLEMADYYRRKLQKEMEKYSDDK